MPHVVISGQAARRFTGGQSEFDVEANNFRRLVLELSPLSRPRPSGRGGHGGGDRRRDLPGRLSGRVQARQRDLPDPKDRRRLTGRDEIQRKLRVWSQNNRNRTINTTVFSVASRKNSLLNRSTN